jgi:hypothetical protein
MNSTGNQPKEAGKLHFSRGADTRDRQVRVSGNIVVLKKPEPYQGEGRARHRACTRSPRTRDFRRGESRLMPNFVRHSAIRFGTTIEAQTDYTIRMVAGFAEVIEIEESLVVGA